MENPKNQRVFADIVRAIGNAFPDRSDDIQKWLEDHLKSICNSCKRWSPEEVVECYTCRTAREETAQNFLRNLRRRPPQLEEESTSSAQVLEKYYSKVNP